MLLIPNWLLPLVCTGIRELISDSTCTGFPFLSHLLNDRLAESLFLQLVDKNIYLRFFYMITPFKKFVEYNKIKLISCLKPILTKPARKYIHFFKHEFLPIRKKNYRMF